MGSHRRNAEGTRFIQRRRPLQERARETTDAIIRATAHILSREKPERLTTNRIAEKAGVSIGSLYQYFPNKEVLVAEVRRRFDAAFRDKLVAAMAHAARLPVRQAVGEFVRTLVALHAEHPQLHNAVSVGIPESERALLEQIVARYLEAHRREVRRPDLPMAAAMSLDVAEALVHGVALRAPERLADEAFVAEVTDLLVRYLAR